MGGVPSVPRDPSRKVQVICAGYSRTGTSTMALAVEKLLGGPFFHGGTQTLNREDAYCKKWVDVYEARKRGDKEVMMKLLREVTAGFVGVGDLPILDFIPELMELYPEAKVVLVEREPDRWLESVKVVSRAANKPWLPYFVWVVPGWRWFPVLVRHYGEGARRILALEPRQGVKPETKLLINYNNMVKDIVPREKLLVMELKQGWEPLCKFLGVPVPNEPLPRANDTAAATEISNYVTRRLVQIWTMGLGTTAALGFGAWTVWKTMPLSMTFGGL
ncbi:P-loop containing nucleoside triphosphate hydrolase protein [Xylaria intraflava]|nr:P-loop containing nucleoside triphosphate hydrolase protein [Xylaria intraflava]